jgi:hypothetical protein
VGESERHHARASAGTARCEARGSLLFRQRLNSSSDICVTPHPLDPRTTFLVRRHGGLLPRIVLDRLGIVPAVSSCGQPDPRDRAKEPTEGREADYPVVTLELRAEIEPAVADSRTTCHTSHSAPERHRGKTEEQREHPSVPYELDRPYCESHGRCPQRVVEQLHSSKS